MVAGNQESLRGEWVQILTKAEVMGDIPLRVLISKPFSKGVCDVKGMKICMDENDSNNSTIQTV